MSFGAAVAPFKTEITQRNVEPKTTLTGMSTQIKYD